MKFSISQSELQHILTVVSKGISTHSTMPILSGVLIKAENNVVVLQTTDLDRSIQYTASALIEEEGSVVVPAKLFLDITKSLPDAAVYFEADDSTATILCESSTFSLRVMNSLDFPAFPEVEITDQVEIPFSIFSSMVKKVAKTVSRDQSRAILMGVHIQVLEDKLRMVSTDSYRLALTEQPIEPTTVDFKATIAGPFLLELAALPLSDEPIVISLAYNQIMVTYRDTVFINRKIEGNYPNYKQLLPDNHTTCVTFNTKQCIGALKRASLLGGNNLSVRFDIHTDSQTLELSSVSQDIGSAKEAIPVTIEGEPMQTGFNAGYVLEGLSQIDTEMATLELVSSAKPGIFKATEEQNFLYLVMPVRLD